MRNDMTEHLIPNNNADIMLGLWMDGDGEEPELDVHPIISFVVSVEHGLKAVISPAWPDKIDVDHEQYRLYHASTGMVYNRIGDRDPAAELSVRHNNTIIKNTEFQLSFTVVNPLGGIVDQTAFDELVMDSVERENNPPHTG